MIHLSSPLYSPLRQWLQGRNKNPLLFLVKTRALHMFLFDLSRDARSTFVCDEHEDFLSNEHESSNTSNETRWHNWIFMGIRSRDIVLASGLGRRKIIFSMFMSMVNIFLFRGMHYTCLFENRFTERLVCVCILLQLFRMQRTYRE